MKKVLSILVLLVPGVILAQPTVMWDTLIGGLNTDCISAIDKDPNDNSVYLIGFTRSPQVSGYHAGANSAAEDNYVTKTDDQGNILWSKAFGTVNSEIASKGKILADGSIVVVGSISPTWPLQTMPPDYQGNNDIFVTRISSSGNLIWQKCYGGSGGDVGVDVIIAPDGTILIAAETSSPADGDLVGTVPRGNVDGLLVRLDSLGALLAVNRAGGSSQDKYKSITNLSTGGFAVIGITLSNNGTINGRNHGIGTSDAWVLCLDNNLDTVWTRCVGTTGQEESVSIIESLGTILISGSAIENIPVNGDIIAYKGNKDSFIAAMTITNTLLWVSTYGGTENDYELRLKSDALGGIYAFGVTESSDLDVPSNLGYEDMWILKVDVTDGSIMWVLSLGTPGMESMLDILLFSPDNMVSVGQHVPTPNQILWDAQVIGIGASLGGYQLRVGNVVTSIFAVQSSNDVSIYPNPTSGMMRITMPPETTTNTVTIYNISGQVLFSEQTNEVAYTTDLAQFAQGTYVVEVKNSTGVFRGRVQKL